MSRRINITTDDKTVNRLHHEYGLFSNIKYIARAMFSYQPRMKGMILLCMIVAPVMSYLWTFISKLVIDMITGEAEVGRLVWLMIGVFAVQLVFTLLNTWAGAQTWWRYIYVRFKLIAAKNYKCMTMRFQNLEDSDVMDCYQKAGNAANGNNNGIEGMMRLFENFGKSVMVVAVGLIIMGTMNPFIMLGMMALAVVNFLIKNKANKISKFKVWDPLATWWRKHWYFENMMTDFSAAKDIRMYGLKDYLVARFHELNKTRLEAERTNQRIWWIVSALSGFIWVLSQGGLYAWLIYSVVKGNMSLGNFSLYLGSAATFFNYVIRILDLVNDMLARSREVDDWRSYMDIEDEPETETVPVPKADVYEFTFENVSFKYPKADRFALKNLNLTVKAGERLAVVGLNGAGKTTFIKLLLRLYEPTEGRILMNGIEITRFRRADYYNVFAPVFQDVNLFAFPMAENVSMNTTSETDRKRVTECLEAAGLKEKLDSLEHGIDTELLKVIYDDGVDLSGGEKQKLALARALYKNAPVVVLDEPTAALDALAESKLYQDFDKMIGHKTAVYISHRLSSTQFCAHVAMFKDGEMVEYGTHEELLKANGHYAEMFNVQAQYYVDDVDTKEPARPFVPVMGGEADV